MYCLTVDGSFESWRDAARLALQAGLGPQEVQWNDGQATPGLFDSIALNVPQSNHPIAVSPELLKLLKRASRWRGETRWSLLYRVLWRYVRGERSAILPGDEDGSVLHNRIKAVRREAHHLHAFLRLQPCSDTAAPDFVAWFEPAHDILPEASEHFCDRLGQHSWLIATPRDGVYWDGRTLRHERECPVQWRDWAQNPEAAGQALWQAYYSSTFNPARLNPKVMAQHLPVRFWKNLPEGPLIGQMMSDARAGAQRDGQAQHLAGRKGKRIERAPVNAADGPDRLR